MPKHHTVISGTGRAGTTFLVQLLTELGLETGFTPGEESGTASSGGLEWDTYDDDAPYVIKGPRLCDMLDDLISGGDFVVDHAIIPVRDLFAAAESRRGASREGQPGRAARLVRRRRNVVPGGLWQTTKPENQESVLTAKLYNLVLACATHDVPVTLLHFPRLVQDPRYLYDKLRFLFGDVSFGEFEMAFERVSKPDLVHEFTAGD